MKMNILSQSIHELLSKMILTLRHCSSGHLEEEERRVLFLLFNECIGDIYLHRRRYQRHHQAYDRATATTKKHDKERIESVRRSLSYVFLHKRAMKYGSTK